MLNVNTQLECAEISLSLDSQNYHFNLPNNSTGEKTIGVIGICFKVMGKGYQQDRWTHGNQAV